MKNTHQFYQAYGIALGAGIGLQVSLHSGINQSLGIVFSAVGGLVVLSFLGYKTRQNKFFKLLFVLFPLLFLSSFPGYANTAPYCLWWTVGGR